MKRIFGIAFVTLLSYAGHTVVTNGIADSKWTLMVCSSLMSDGVSCQNTSFKVPGYSSYAECFTAGSNYKNDGFECGRGCDMNDYGMNVCKEICNAGGCAE